MTQNEKPLLMPSSRDSVEKRQNSTGAVLFVMPHLSFGGAERLASHILRDLVQSGTRCSVAVVTRNRRIPDAASSWFAPVCPVHMIVGDVDPALSLRAIIQAEDVATVVLCGRSPAYEWLGSLVAQFPHLRIVTFQFNAVDSIDENSLFSSFIDATIVECHDAATQLVAAGMPEHKMALIPSGVDVPSLACRILPERGARPICVAFVGRFDKTKNPEGYIRMAAVLRRSDISLLMVGTGKLMLRMRLLAFQLGLYRQLVFRGLLDGEAHQQQMDSIDILVVPSRIDGRPLVIQEAKSRGIAVVAHSVGGIPELVEHGVTGLLCPPDDPAALARAVARLIDDGDLRHRLGQAGKEDALRNGNLADRLPLYKSVITGRQ